MATIFRELSDHPSYMVKSLRYFKVVFGSSYIRAPVLFCLTFYLFSRTRESFLHYHRHLKVKGLKFLSTFELLIVLSLILIRYGDIELNPGPELDSDSSSSTASAFSDLELKNKFSVVHYNVKSILNKVDIIQSELQQFDVISLTETWLDNTISDDEIIFNGLNLFRRDRVNDRHGGVCVFVKRELYAKRRIDLELQNTEFYFWR